MLNFSNENLYFLRIVPAEQYDLDGIFLSMNEAKQALQNLLTKFSGTWENVTVIEDEEDFYIIEFDIIDPWAETSSGCASIILYPAEKNKKNFSKIY